ncbi:MAG TPA: asparaginase [Stenomitos sp.]
MPVLLAEATRGDWVESRHYGWAVLVDAHGHVVEEIGDAVEVFARSSLKPFQAMPLLLSGAADRLGLTETELAIACSSHSGTERHVAEARSILEKAGVDPAYLHCGAHLPLYEPTAERMRCAHEAPTPLHNNCSGKHAGMLAVCQDQGWDLATYYRFEHPLQQEIRRYLADLTGLRPEDLVAGIDGCGIPAWRLPLRSLAVAFARLVADPRLERLERAMAHHPDLVAGEGRFDTILMEAAGGHLVTKAGAEAIHAGCDRTSGLAWAVKIADGNRRVIPPVVLKLLDRHGVLSDSERQALASWIEPTLVNHAGTRVGVLRSAR